MAERQFLEDINHCVEDDDLDGFMDHVYNFNNFIPLNTFELKLLKRVFDAIAVVVAEQKMREEEKRKKEEEELRIKKQKEKEARRLKQLKAQGIATRKQKCRCYTYVSKCQCWVQKITQVSSIKDAIYIRRMFAPMIFHLRVRVHHVRSKMSPNCLLPSNGADPSSLYFRYQVASSTTLTLILK